MRFLRGVGIVTLAGILLSALAACSVDTVIWGADGAKVIETTEHLIQAAAAGEGEDIACVDSNIDFGTPGDWEGLAAGEPERFSARGSLPGQRVPG
ncbi:MAG: hypothetical protein ACK5KO_05355 [Arachnia sp.]